MDELAKLRLENEQLQQRMDELEQRLLHYVDDQSSAVKQECWAEMYITIFIPYFLK